MFNLCDRFNPFKLKNGKNFLGDNKGNIPSLL